MPEHTSAFQTKPGLILKPAGAPVNVLVVCIELRITKLSPKKIYFAVAKQVGL